MDQCCGISNLQVFTIDLDWAGVISAIAHSKEEAYELMNGSVVIGSLTKEQVLERMESEPIKIGIIVENLGDR